MGETEKFQDFTAKAGGAIAAAQLNALPEPQQKEVFQVIGKFYQAQLEGEPDQNSARVSFKHNSETNAIDFSMHCQLEKAIDLLNEAEKLVSQLYDRHLEEYRSNEPND